MNTNTCSYCGSSLGNDLPSMTDKAYCGFCEMFVKPSVNGERIEQFRKVEFIGYEQIRMPTSELVEMHTKSLLELLKYMREERRSYFNNMRVLKQGASVNPEFKEGDKISSEEYEMITKKCFVVENILRERMGYIPKKITENLLLSYDQRCSDLYNERPMTINRPERTIEKSEGMGR